MDQYHTRQAQGWFDLSLGWSFLFSCLLSAYTQYLGTRSQKAGCGALILICKTPLFTGSSSSMLFSFSFLSQDFISIPSDLLELRTLGF